MLAKSFSDMITFTRPGDATYVDAAGVIQTAAADVPRFDYTHGKRGLLLEGPATNSVKYSNYLVPSFWNTQGASIAEAGTNSLGEAYFTLSADASGSAHKIYQTATSSESTVTASAIVKAGTHQYVKIGSGGTGNGFTAAFDLSSGVLLGQSGTGTYTNIDAGIVPLADGWYRIWASGSATGTDGCSIHLGRDASDLSPNIWSANGTETLLVCCVQYEIGGSYPTSYIPTEGSAVTRPADKAQLAEPVAALLRRGEASVLLQGQGLTGPGGGRIIGGTSARFLGFNSAGDKIIAGNMAELVISDVTAPLGDFGTAVGLSAAGKRGSYNGSVTVSDAEAMDADMTTAFIGRRSGGSFAPGWYYQLVIWLFRMINADLQAKAVPHA